MMTLAKKLRSSRLLGQLSSVQIAHLLEKSGVRNAEPGEILQRESESSHEHLILLKGELEIQRTWQVHGGNDRSYTRTLKSTDNENGFSFLFALNNTRVRTLSEVEYVALNADLVDEMLGWSSQFSEEFTRDPELSRRMNLVKRAGIFYEVPLENVKDAFRCMKSRVFNPGDVVVREGELGDCYYVIEDGEAEVYRTDPFSGETAKVDDIGRGDAFGEESLLQNAYRNATIIMKTPGNLLVLDKADFDLLLKPHIIEEISAMKAQALLKSGQAKLIDCRYEMEYEESRIPDAPLYPLDKFRKLIHKLDPDSTYIVYCRSGRRSKAAAFLLRERNIIAFSLIGGIRDWPYDIDYNPLDLDNAGSADNLVRSEEVVA